MALTPQDVSRIAHLARIAVTDAEVPHLQGELNAILSFVEQLNEVNVDGVEPMTSVTPMTMKKRQDGDLYSVSLDGRQVTRYVNKDRGRGRLPGRWCR